VAERLTREAFIVGFLQESVEDVRKALMPR
jgi:hypothetical protein